MPEKLICLACPYCGSPIEAEEVYPDSSSIVISCQGCRATWHSDGSPYTPPAER